MSAEQFNEKTGCLNRIGLGWLSRWQIKQELRFNERAIGEEFYKKVMLSLFKKI
ncbi:MAG: hypothetical protein M1514_00265 [Patescibacteria group bacterium]|nr:hypothetical protein [Patescibacteria group bacterium]